MVFPTWFPELPASWTLLAKLHLNIRHMMNGDCVVEFYATVPSAIQDLRAKLPQFSRGLPPGAWLEYDQTLHHDDKSKVHCPR
jgi:hypothetical protein